jgi:hypothetical protein
MRSVSWMPNAATRPTGLPHGRSSPGRLAFMIFDSYRHDGWEHYEYQRRADFSVR